MKNLKPIVAIMAVIILILVAYIFKDDLFNFGERKVISEYEIIKNKTVLEMTEKEWEIRNKYELIVAKKNGTKPDTISYNSAKNAEELRMLVKQINNPCTQTRLIEAFHQIMEFNRPYDKYDRYKINVQMYGNCTIRVSVTTTEPKYGWKTFWIFEVTYNAITDEFESKPIRRDFLG